MSTGSLPLEVKSVLRSVGMRRVAQTWVLSHLAVLTGTVTTILLWIFVDAYFNLPPWLRAAGQGVALGVFAALVVTMIRRAMRHRKDDAALARDIDRTYPELQERFSTCRDLLQQSIPPTRTERWFRAQLQREMLPQLGAIDPERVVANGSGTWILGVLFVGILFLTIAPVLWWGDGYGQLGARWFDPWANHGWGRFATITISPTDGFAVRDRDFAVGAIYKPHRPTEGDTTPALTVHWRGVGDQTWMERSLESHEFGRYHGIIPHVPRDIEWYVTGPAAESPRTITRVVDPPEVMAFTAMIDPPGYTGQPSRQATVVGDLAVLAESRVRLSILWNQPLRKAELFWPSVESSGDPVTHSITLTDRGTRGSVDVVATKSGPFTLRLTTPQGLIHEDSPRSLSVRPDQPPLVKLAGPTSLALRPDDRHEIAAHADDDFGLTAAELRIDIADRVIEPVPLPLAPGRNTSADLASTLDLLPLKLSPGTSVVVRVRVLDNREHPGPQEGWSEPQVIVISPSAVSDAERRLADNTRQSRNELAEIIKELEEERKTLRDIHQKTAAATVRQKQAEQDEQLKKIAAAHEELQQRLSDFAATMLPDDEPGEALQKQVEQVVNGPLESAADRLEATPDLEPRDQIPALSKALDDLAAAKKALQKVDDALIARSALGDDLQTLRQLANRSDRVADQLDQAGDEPAAQQAAEAVKQIQDELAQVVKRRPEWQAAMTQAEQAERAEQEQMRQAQAAGDQPASALAPENTPASAESMPEEAGPPMPGTKPSSATTKTDAVTQPSGPVPVEAGAELSKAQQDLREAQSSLSSDGERHQQRPTDDGLPKPSAGPSQTQTPAPGPSPAENGNGPPAVIALQEAARALRAAVEKTAGPASSGEPGVPQKPRDAEGGRDPQMAGQPGEAGASAADAALTDFAGHQTKGTSNRNWGRLPTGLKTEILQGGRRPANGDYARQVQRYFERIAQPSESTP